MAMGLELPEETFVNIHNWDIAGETWGACFQFQFFAIGCLKCRVL